MVVSTPEGKYHENDFDYWHEQLFGEPKQDPGGEGKMFFVRHGDTNCNDEDVVHGWVKQGLNDRGIEQAHKAAESLKNKKPTRIIYSDLNRSKQTAFILAKELGIDDIQPDPRLRTWDSGDFDYTHKHAELAKYTKPSEQPSFAERYAPVYALTNEPPSLQDVGNAITSEHRDVVNKKGQPAWWSTDTPKSNPDLDKRPWRMPSNPDFYKEMPMPGSSFMDSNIGEDKFRNAK